MTARYRIFGTTADLGVVSHGGSLTEAFENQAKGMFAAMADLRGVRPTELFTVAAKGPDDEGLLLRFLEELLFIFDTKGVLLRRFEITSITRGSLKARAWGERIDQARHVVKTPIKAVTHHMSEVKKARGGYSTRVIYDI